MFIEMRTDRSFDVTRIFKAKAQDNFVEDWVEASPFSQHFSGMFDADNNNPIPNTQEWGHHTHWASSNPAFHTDQKRALYSEGAITPQRPYYWQLMNHCPQQEAVTPNPGVESWSYSGSMLPPALSSSNSPICSRRNGDSFRQNVHNWPRPPHLLFPGGPFPMSEGGPPSLPPSILFPRQPERSNRILSRYWESTPPYCAAQTMRQRPGVDTPPRFSTSTNAIYPPTSIQHNDSSTTPFSTLPYYTASTYGMPSTSLRNQSNVQLATQNPDSMNYTDHGCYSLPVTTTACDHQYKANQRSRPLNISSTPLAKQGGPIIQNASGAVKQGLHRRALSDPGPCSLEDSNVMPSNPPPPPPPLRIDNYMKGRQRNLRLGVEPSVIQDNQWGEQNEDRKAHRMEPSKEISVIRGNESSETESEMSGIQMKPLKGNVQAANKSGCCCSCWSSQKKLLEEMLTLKEANRKICREMKEMRKEIDDFRMVLPNPALGKQSNGFLGWQYQGLEYNPGMISELVEEVREAAQVREEAFLAHIHSSIMSQGLNCGCGQALLQDGSVDELNRKKANCWWWNRSQWGKTSANSCIPLNSKNIPSPKNKLSSDTTELENLKEMLQEVQDEKKQTDVRLRMLEEELNKYKLSNEIISMRRISHQENESSMEERGDTKLSKDNSSRQGFDACKTEEPVNQEIVLLRNEVQKLRIQLQNTLTTKDSIVQDQKIEQLTALLQRLMCPANGLSLSSSTSYPAPTCTPQNLQEVSEKPENGDETPFARQPSVNEASVEKLIQSMSFAKSDGGEDEERANSSPPNSLESNCSSSSSSSPLNFSSCHPPVTIHGPVTDL